MGLHIHLLACLMRGQAYPLPLLSGHPPAGSFRTQASSVMVGKRFVHIEERCAHRELNRNISRHR